MFTWKIQFAVSKNGFVRNVNYFIENNKAQNNNNDKNINNNNNDSAAINYNEKMGGSSSANASFEKDLHGLSVSNIGAASLELQKSLQSKAATSASLSSLSPPSLSSSMCGLNGSQKIGTRQTLDGIDATTTSSSLNNSTQSDLDARFALNSTKILQESSFESSYNTSAPNAFELNLNIMPSYDASNNEMMEHRERKLTNSN